MMRELQLGQNLPPLDELSLVLNEWVILSPTESVLRPVVSYAINKWSLARFKTNSSTADRILNGAEVPRGGSAGFAPGSLPGGAL